ncbi:hypothetical protein DPMN_039842 [Dreissena polymorpha]|uniref:Uncharacterized protein n=1 Tax=Dreissena polymorpha TaxID=45954 RepID=A0A9D4CW07_DREPO|nr:hypothetical protein DPMN_039842 [Dreissena polymorpha]
MRSTLARASFSSRTSATRRLNPLTTGRRPFLSTVIRLPSVMTASASNVQKSPRLDHIHIPSKPYCETPSRVQPEALLLQ